MKPHFLAALGALGLLLASCSDEKSTETTAAAPAAGESSLVPTSATPIPVGDLYAADTITYRTDARHLADRVAADLKLADPITERRLEKVYFVRRQRRAQLDRRYTADTTGRYAALRQLNDDTDREVRQVLPSPALTRTYERGRAGYYDGPLTATAASAEAEVSAEATPVVAATGTTSARRSAPRRGARIVKYKKSGDEVKIKYSDGTKVKIGKDGRRRVRHGLGAKKKLDAALRRLNAKKGE
ncbi:hypothetical protein [uncultured Hymenobacter sp.]|uniref:hypothetical protein n=1 Tax=uncultured Hymenobacter sp. TaxID=170016 RepID=UPI0035C96288